MESKRFSDSQSSVISLRRAETRRSRDFSLGNKVATRVRRLISRLSLSRELVVRSFLRGVSGRLKTVRASGALASSQAANLGAEEWYLRTTSLRRRRADWR